MKVVALEVFSSKYLEVSSLIEQKSVCIVFYK